MDSSPPGPSICGILQARTLEWIALPFYSTLTASSFMIWNSSAGIPSPLLALFIVMLPKAHLTSRMHSRMSDSQWVITPSWLSGSLRPFFVQFFCLFLPPLLNIFSFCWVLTISVLYCVHLCMNVPLVSLIFLKRSLVFPILLFSSVSLHCSLRKAFLSLLWRDTTLWNSAFKWEFPFLLCLSILFSQLFVIHFVVMVRVLQIKLKLID